MHNMHNMHIKPTQPGMVLEYRSLRKSVLVAIMSLENILVGPLMCGVMPISITLKLSEFPKKNEV